MMAPASSSSRWPARAAYVAAAIFTLASGGTNLIYGWQKGADLAGSVVWAGVSLGAAIIFALSWPATIKSLEARRWSAAAMSIVALLLAGSYSVTAALGSASGGRANAAATETAMMEARSKAQSSYDAAKAELDVLAAAKPAAELQSLIEGAKAQLAKLPAARSVAEVEASLRATQREPQRYGCALINGSMAMSCPKLDGELARAQQRERLTAKIAGWTADIGQADQRQADRRARLKADMDRASGELAKIQPARVANSDAKALARFLLAVGIDATPDRLNDLLVLLAVVMIESGGGLSLALGMALSAAPVVPDRDQQASPPVVPDRPAVPTDASPAHPEAAVVGASGPPPGPASEILIGTQRSAAAPQSISPGVGRARQVVPDRSAVLETSQVRFLAMVRDHGGQTIMGQRAIAEALGISKTQVARLLSELSATGRIGVEVGRRGTAVRLIS